VPPAAQLPTGRSQNAAGPQSAAEVHGCSGGGHSPAEATTTPAAPAVQALPYVRPSQPHTGSKTWMQIWGRGAHSPSPAHVPRGRAQNCPGSQSALVLQRGSRGEGSSGHLPVAATLAPFDAAAQRFEYVFPSQPQTGSTTAGQTPGRATHSPAASHAPSGRRQSSVAEQSVLARQVTAPRGMISARSPPPLITSAPPRMARDAAPPRCTPRA
jgi:hypothetical protein